MTTEQPSQRTDEQSNRARYAIAALYAVVLAAGLVWLAVSRPWDTPPDESGTGPSSDRQADIVTPPVPASRPIETFTNSIGMEFASIEPGEFIMGSPADEQGREGHERQRRVELSKSFYLGMHEVTQAQWHTVMGSKPSHFKGEDLPVEQVSWDDATAFCQELSELEGKKYRLPIEAEWEYACRAGSTTPFSTGPTISPDQANYDGNFTYGDGNKGANRKTTTPAGSFPPNPWGVYDMHGNVWEWCQDKYPGGEGHRVLRGGSWYDPPRYCRSAGRCRFAPAYRFALIGFRVAMDLPD